MEPKIKSLAQAITHTHTQHLVQSHVKALEFNEDTKHLVIVVDNAAPMHELESEEGDKHLNSGLVKIYGDDMTYEVRLASGEEHERENLIPHNINQ